MARLHRSCPPGYTQHVIQRGNNRAPCCGDDADRYQYIEWLSEYAQEFAVAVHAWVLMTNHVHLLATPSTEGGLSRLMQFLGRRYVRYFNKTCQRTGTLWEGRFKSCVVQGVHYALRCHVYIEMNPVRAGMVSRPGEYQHSSYRCHAAGGSHVLWTPHPEYLALGADQAQRLETYQRLLSARAADDAQQIRDATNKGLALGTAQFKNQLEQLHQRRLRPATLGRPKKISSDPNCLTEPAA